MTQTTTEMPVGFDQAFRREVLGDVAAIVSGRIVQTDRADDHCGVELQYLGADGSIVIREWATR